MLQVMVVFSLSFWKTIFYGNESDVISYSIPLTGLSSIVRNSFNSSAFYLLSVFHLCFDLEVRLLLH